jgi:hypothetical protein
MNFRKSKFYSWFFDETLHDMFHSISPSSFLSIHSQVRHIQATSETPLKSVTKERNGFGNIHIHLIEMNIFLLWYV